MENRIPAGGEMNELTEKYFEGKAMEFADLVQPVDEKTIRVVALAHENGFTAGLDAAIAAVKEIENKSEYWNSLEGLNKSDTAMKAISSAIAAISALKE